MGIMSNGDGTDRTAVDQLIEGCLIYRNGDPAEPGQNHNLYLGGTSVLLRGCEVHSSLTGHNVKSRAHLTRVFACYVHDSANREFDLVDASGDTTAPGSDAVLAGNIIVKDRRCPGNRAVIHFGQDGGNEHDGELLLVHNTIVTPFVAPVIHLTAPKARAQCYNNIVWDGGAYQKGQLLAASVKDEARVPVTGRANWLSYGFTGAALDALPLQETAFGSKGSVLSFADAGKGDYRLSAADPQIVDTGCTIPDNVTAAMGGALLQYKAEQGFALRALAGKADLGAVEWNLNSKPGQ
jgi:hypothetical protein